MKYITPEEAGVHSSSVKKYIELLEKNQLSTHDMIISKGDDIFFEKYWHPFKGDMPHRMYSVTKSFVSLAIGFLEQDGRISLNDRIAKYFPKETKNQTDENMLSQTIKNMLMMSTAKPEYSFFTEGTNDRVAFYFGNDKSESRPPGTIFSYDSGGSFIMGALVERLTGKTLLEYLREKLFDKIGISDSARFLKCPGGHSWGDSALLCTPMDLWKTARFVMNRGKWNGCQLLNEKYITDATTKRIDNNVLGIDALDALGYGYQFWITRQNSYFMNGMGCQFAICVPHKQLILIYNGDNQGKVLAKSIVIDGFFDIIVNDAEDLPIKENPKEQKELLDYASDLKLAAAIGGKHSDFEEKINGKIFNLKENPMGIKRFSLSFKGDKGSFNYTNSQGDKTIKFGMCTNEFGFFPEEGYSKEIASKRADGNYYKCAASAAWTEPKKLFIKVQIIDDYLGNLNISIGFSGEKVGIYMNKVAEGFLNEYEGFAGN